jgi:hypothetical protein
VKDVAYVPKTTSDKGQGIPPQVQSAGGTPFENLNMDFTEMSHARGWVETFPTWTEKAHEVARCLLKESIPLFGIPVSIGLDDGPDFMTEVVQLVAKGLGMTWKLLFPVSLSESSYNISCWHNKLDTTLLS